MSALSLWDLVDDCVRLSAEVQPDKPAHASCIMAMTAAATFTPFPGPPCLHCVSWAWVYVAHTERHLHARKCRSANRRSVSRVREATRRAHWTERDE